MLLTLHQLGLCILSLDGTKASKGTIAITCLEVCQTFNAKIIVIFRIFVITDLQHLVQSWIYNPCLVNIYWLTLITREVFSISLMIVLPWIIWYCWYATILTKKGQFHMVQPNRWIHKSINKSIYFCCFYLIWYYATGVEIAILWGFVTWLILFFHSNWLVCLGQPEIEIAWDINLHF